MCMGSPKAPAPAPRLPEAPVMADPSGLAMASAAKRRRASSTILTTTQGATDTATTGTGVKTLLGQ